MPDPFATTTGRVAVVVIAAMGGALGGGYMTADGVEERIARAEMRGRVEAIERMTAIISTRLESHTKDISILTRTADQHADRIRRLEGRLP